MKRFNLPLLGLLAAFSATVAFGAITADQIDLLNNHNGSIAKKVALGTLIQTAETVAPADASVTAAKLATDSVTTVKITDLNVTTGKLAADAVTNAKIADLAVSTEHLDSGISFSHRVVAAGTFTTAGGDDNESITATGVVGTDLILCQLKTKGGTPRTILTCAANTGTIDAVFSGDPSTDHVVYWVALRASS